MNKYEQMHQRNMVRYSKQIEEIFNAACKEAASLGMSVEGITSLLETEMFKFSDYPITSARLDAMLKQLRSKIELCVLNGVEHEWTLANNKHNELSRRVFGDNIGLLTDEQYQRYFSNHSEALQAFKARQVNGLNLSDRVWNYTNGFQNEIESALSVALGQGKSAEKVASELKQYLKEPDRLYRRVRDKYGNLVPSKAMAAYHSGQGVYRSSFKNARRLAVTETNMAFRNSDHLRIQDEEFVVGIKIVLSNNHTCKGVKGVFFDICDQLQGKYPKDFKFVGWHPHCRCHIETILKTEQEVDEDFERILEGKEPVTGSVNEVNTVPANFNKWLVENEERSRNQYSIPYFMRDNMGKYVPAKYIEAYASRMPYKTYQEYEQAIKYNAKHANFTDDVKRNNAELSKVLPVKQGQIMPMGMADRSNCNPDFHLENAEDLGYIHNCQTCTVTYLMRRRGFNVEAKSNPYFVKTRTDVRDIDVFYYNNKMNWQQRFLNTDGSQPTYKFLYGGTSKANIDFVTSQAKERGIYEIYCKWENGGAHVFIAERNSRNELVLLDPQTGLRGDVATFKKNYFDKMENCAILRIDDKLINPKMARRIIKSRTINV